MENGHFLSWHISLRPWVGLRWERKQNEEQRELFPSIPLRETDFWFHQFHSHGKLPFSLLAHISPNMGQMETREKAKCRATRALSSHSMERNRRLIPLFHGHGKLPFSLMAHISPTMGQIEAAEKAKYRATRALSSYPTVRNRLLIPLFHGHGKPPFSLIAHISPTVGPIKMGGKAK